MSNILKNGTRVRIQNCTNLGVKDGSLGTIMEYISTSGFYYINTDKLNNFNHNQHNGNGIWILTPKVTPLTKRGRWAEPETDYLHQQYRRRSVSFIAEYLNRSYYSVQGKAKQEGIHKHPRRDYSSNDNHVIIHDLIDNIPLTKIQSKLHRSKSSINGRIRLMDELGLIPTIKGAN